MTMGRPPIPPEIKALRSGKLPPRLTFGDGPVQKPSWLDEYGSQEWDRIVPELEKLKLICFVDVAVLAAYCYCHSEWRHSMDIIEEDGRLVPGSLGQKKTHPAASHAKDMLKLLSTYATHLGFSPQSRMKIQFPKPDDAKQTALDKFLEGEED